MKHFILSTAWVYNPVIEAFSFKHGFRGSEVAFVSIAGLKPRRQLLIEEDRGRWRLAKGVDMTNYRLVSTIALPPDGFAVELSGQPYDFSIRKSESPSTNKNCLLFSQCDGSSITPGTETTGKLLCAYPRWSSDSQRTLVFAALIEAGERLVFDDSNLLQHTFSFDGEVLTISKE